MLPREVFGRFELINPLQSVEELIRGKVLTPRPLRGFHASTDAQPQVFSKFFFLLSFSYPQLRAKSAPLLLNYSFAKAMHYLAQLCRMHSNTGLRRLISGH